MSEPTNFYVRAGLPFARRIRITDGKNVWANLIDFETRMHIRVAEDSKSTLKFDFTPFLSKSFDLNDIIVEWDMNGSQTRELRGGYYDLIVSDVGAIDVRALPPIIYGQLNVLPLITAAEGAS